MSKPSLKALSLKERIYKKITAFLDNPFALRGLTYSRYKQFKGNSVYHSTEYHRERNERLRKEDFELSLLELTGLSAADGRKHKRHVMHSERRVNCVSLLKLLVKRLDIATLECLLVAPSYKIRRPLYVSEMARECGVTKRTIQNCLQSLTLAGYIKRKKDLSSGRIDRKGVLRCHHRVYLTPKFFESVKSNIALERLRQYLKGKGRLVAIRAENKRVEERLSQLQLKSNSKTENSLPVRPANYYKSGRLKDKSQRSEQEIQKGNSHLKNLRKLLGNGPPVPS
jgi:predicted transcriptional regulator